MDWNSLISAVIGGLLAVIPVLITIRNQTRERDKDRQEQRREAALLAREKWTERDILKLMEILDRIMQLLADERNREERYNDLVARIAMGAMTEEESKAEFLTLYKEQQDHLHEFARSFDSMGRFVYSFEETDKILASFDEFREAAGKWATLEKRKKARENTKYGAWIDANIAAGKFQQALREKLISIRDT